MLLMEALLINAWFYLLIAPVNTRYFAKHVMAKHPVLIRTRAETYTLTALISNLRTLRFLLNGKTEITYD